MQHGWLGASDEERGLKGQCHVLLGARARPHVELWRAGANLEEASWKRKAGDYVAGNIGVENNGLGFPGHSATYYCVTLSKALNLSESQWSYLGNGDIHTGSVYITGEINS